MKAVSVRELKKDPLAAIRAARAHPVVVLNHHRPEALLVHLDAESILDEPGIRHALATALFREQSLSLGRASRFTGLPITDFVQHLFQLGIPVIQGTAESAREDGDIIEDWLKGSSPPPAP